MNCVQSLRSTSTNFDIWRFFVSFVYAVLRCRSLVMVPNRTSRSCAHIGWTRWWTNLCTHFKNTLGYRLCFVLKILKRQLLLGLLFRLKIISNDHVELICEKHFIATCTWVMMIQSCINLIVDCRCSSTSSWLRVGMISYAQNVLKSSSLI